MIDLVKEHPFWFLLILANMVISLRICFGLWILPQHQETSVTKRLFWSIVIFFPFTGPMLFLALYRIPSIHRDGGAPVNSDAFYGGGL